MLPPRVRANMSRKMLAQYAKQSSNVKSLVRRAVTWLIKAFFFSVFSVSQWRIFPVFHHHESTESTEEYKSGHYRQEQMRGKW